MVKACLFYAFLCLVLVSPLQAFSWETATSKGREYVTLQSFCTFYGFGYQHPGGSYFDTRSQSHTLRFKLGSPDMYLDGVHYVMSFAVEEGDHDWLVSRMDVIKLFEPVLRPGDLSDRHAIRGVVLDAGHGGSDNGAVSSRGGMEKSYTIDTVGRLEAILRNAGLKTVLTRRSDVFVDLYERAHIASLYPDYVFVSIHFNSATEEARGLETYCLSPRGAASTSSAYLTRSDIQKLPGNDYDEFNILLASLVHSEIIKLNPGDPTADRGVKRARFVVIKQNVLPAILVEGGFVSNHMEAARVNQADYRQSLAEAVARGVIRFVNVMGNKRMSLPESAPPLAAPAPVAPVAPSGLVSDPAQKNHPPVPAAVKASVPAIAPTASTTNSVAQVTPPKGTSTKTKKGKKKSVATQPVTPSSETPGALAPAVSPPAPAPAPAPAVSTAPVIPGDSGLTNRLTSPVAPPAASSAPLNLAEPATPTPTPGAEKAAAEPDEPPTVNIYPTTPSPAPQASAPAVAPSTPASAPAPAAAESTNASPNPATPGAP